MYRHIPKLSLLLCGRIGDDRFLSVTRDTKLGKNVMVRRYAHDTRGEKDENMAVLGNFDPKKTN